MSVSMPCAAQVRLQRVALAASAPGTGDTRGRRRTRAARRRGAPASAARYVRRERAALSRSTPAGTRRRSRRMAACISSRRVFTPNSSWWYRLRLAAVAQPRQARRQRRVVRDDRAAVAERAEVLRRVEAERARRRPSCRPAGPRTWSRCAWRSPRPPARLCRAAMARIGVHVGRLAVEVHRQDGRRPRRDRGLDGRAGRSSAAPGRCRRTPAARRPS